jgi:transcriptional regulator with XRE-family HTH domain
LPAAVGSSGRVWIPSKTRRRGRKGIGQLIGKELGLALSEFQGKREITEAKVGERGLQMAINYKQSNPEMHQRRVSEFTKHVLDLCAQREIDIYQLAEHLTMDPDELLQIVNGRQMPTDVVLFGLSKALDSDVDNLKKLAEKIGVA